MTYKLETDIHHIGEGLVACTLPKAEWTHAGHFAAAVWLLDHDIYDPFKEMPGFIRRYNLSVGTPNSDTEGYHETITLASLRAVKHILDSRTDGEALHSVVNRLMTSDYGKPTWILDYWTKEKLFSVYARKNWVEPDLQRLPF